AIQSLAQSKVVDGQNKEIGTVTSIMVNPESGKLVRANISLDNNSGFLSFGDQDQHISVPWDQISVKRRQGNMVLVLNQQAIDKIKTEKVKKDETSQGSEKSQQENK
ncbi:MAG TPA: PRC-barrel domain-containing protein, partial [Terriglobales bacterium]|nr:PRC-barrel domain-containing protein [Terriglobales bacterium]